mmetsp:Transcript_24765/g.45393  ORF Transcript_24765/g.45393 Transcript_24765/m.45393 type:complete len:145 (+) Transcript_24765:27-461(+)
MQKLNLGSTRSVESSVSSQPHASPNGAGLETLPQRLTAVSAALQCEVARREVAVEEDTSAKVFTREQAEELAAEAASLRALNRQREEELEVLRVKAREATAVQADGARKLEALQGQVEELRERVANTLGIPQQGDRPSTQLKSS